MDTSGLPEHLRKIEHVYVDASMVDAPVTQRVRERLETAGCADMPWTVVDGGGVLTHSGDEQALYLKEYKGQFLRFCPGTRYYHCCGYRIIHIGENCPLACSYCILQAYFQDRILKVWANQDDLFRELGDTFGADRNKRYRLGTGEFTDSLTLEALTGYSGDLIHFLEQYPNVVLELKSKVIDLSWMESATRTDRVLPAWSVNAPFINEHEELGTSALKERLTAARTVADSGYRVCLHFDPIIRFDGWEDGYADIINMIFEYLKPQEIAYMSLGSFRHMPQLKPIIAENFPQTRYIYDEFIVGNDNKMRLLRPLRLEQFKFLVNRLREKGMGEQMYFCMESSEVWKEVFGYTPAHVGGLNSHLMKCAFND